MSTSDNLHQGWDWFQHDIFPNDIFADKLPYPGKHVGLYLSDNHLLFRHPELKMKNQNSGNRDQL